jgi:hypothetical protein
MEVNGQAAERVADSDWVTLNQSVSQAITRLAPLESNRVATLKLVQFIRLF